MPQFDDISLRHLADVSNASFSFQIPGTIEEEDLLAHGNMDFFRGIDDSHAPLVSPSLSPNQPSQPEPRPSTIGKSNGIISSPKLSYQDTVNDTNAKPEKPTFPVRPESRQVYLGRVSKPRPNKITPLSSAVDSDVDGLIQPQNLNVEIGEHLQHRPSTSHLEMLDIDGQLPKGIRKPFLEKDVPHLLELRQEKNLRTNKADIEQENINIQPTIKQTVAESCGTVVPDPFAILPSSKNHLHSEENRRDESWMEDISMASLGEELGVAKRLVQYSQNLINPFGPLNTTDWNVLPKLSSTSEDLKAGMDASAVRETSVDTDRPLTVSQLSPMKKCPSHSITPTLPVANAAPLARPPTKRPVSVASEVIQSKKRKIDKSTESKQVHNGDVNSETQRPSLKRVPKERVISKTKFSSQTRRPPVFKPESVTKEFSGSKTSSICASASRSTSRSHQITPAISLSLEHATSSNSSSKLVPFNATNPAKFRRQNEGRPEFRKGESVGADAESDSKSNKEKNQRLVIPDFKAMHAAQEARLAVLKENVHPTVPIPIRWETDERLKERHKFDERMREKEREQERIKEERRREQEEQDEMEVRELRRKAVPKAHEVPEWYKEAPKKKDKIFGSIGR